MTLPPFEWIERLIRIDSVTQRSNEDVVRFLVPLLQGAGLKIEEQKVVENGETFVNLIAFNQSLSARDLLVMNTHLDTVSGGDSANWTKTGGDPFKATRVKDRVYGLGTADVKLDFLCKILAAKNAGASARPFALVGTFGEERGLVGVGHLLREKKVKPKYAMVGEPSNLELIYAHKGHFFCTFAIDLDIKNVAFMEPIMEKKWKGLAAHSSTPDVGDNALVKGLMEISKKGFGIVSLKAGTDFNKVPDSCEAKLIRQQTPATIKTLHVFAALDSLRKDFKKKRDARFSPASNTLSFNLARAVDGELHVTFDIRTLPDTNPERLKDRVTKILTLCGCRIVAMAQDPPLRGKKDGEFLQLASKCLKSVGIKPVAKTKASSTEAAMYNQFGAQAIVFGPGLSVGNVHRPNEYNSLKQLEIATRFYGALLTQGDT